MQTKKTLLAGATGYLGQHLANELQKRGYALRILIRREDQKKLFPGADDFVVAQATDAKDIEGICDGIDWVFSTLGITRQKEGLTYMDVDYQANANLLQQALKAQVQAFQYISAINGDKLRHLKIFEAKERFVDELKHSGIRYCVLRPNGFFSDMRDFLAMAQRGKVYLFGDGNYRLNPIHGSDLAKVCVDKMEAEEHEATIGGPETFTQNELAALALKAWGKPQKIRHLPDWTRRFAIALLRTFTSSKTYGPIEFFLTAMASDNIADSYGTHYLEDFFVAEVESKKQKK